MAQEIVEEQDLLVNGGGRTLLNDNLKVIVLFKDGTPFPILQDGGVDDDLDVQNTIDNGGLNDDLDADNIADDGGVDTI